MNNEKLITGIAIGLAAGTILGVLLSPEKGSDIRKKISQKGSDITDSLKAKFNEFVDDASEKYESVRSGAEKLAEEGKEKANNANTELRNAFV